MKTFKGFEQNTADGGFEKASKFLLEKPGYDNCELTKATCDNGVDILTSKDGIEFCVQCKNYEDKVSNDKIRDFGTAIKLYGRTNGIFMTTSSFTSEAIKTAKELGIELWDYSHIRTLSNNLGFDLETLNPTRKRALKSVVFEHNKPVYEQMEKMLADYGKAIVTMGTGIGKTTTALEYCIKHNCRALIVCPSNIIRDSWKNNKANKDDRLLDTTTYQSFAKCYKDINYDEYGVVIFDEVHHGGAEVWGAGVKYLIDNKIMPVIGLTATEERTDGINVADTLFDGHICEGMDILAGIKNEVIYPFTYIGVFYDPENVCQVEKDKYGDKLTETLLGKLDTALNNTKNVRDIIKKDMPKGKRKGIIFSADIESMDDDIKLIKDMYPKSEIRKIHSNMTYNEQKEVKEWFAHTKSGYICTVAMVNEGAHYDGVNTVFMLRKTSSELIFMQQLGRAITSVYGHNDPHTVIFDLVNSSKAIQNVKRKFKESGVEESVKAIEVTEEQYDAIVNAIDNGVITPVENDDIIEISSEDISVLTEATDVKIDLEKENECKKARELTRTIYVKDKVEFNTDYGKSKQVIVKDYTRPIVEVIEELHNEFDLKPWTEEEDNIIKKYFPIENRNVYKRLLNRTKEAVGHRAKKLGLVTRIYWTKEEDEILKKYYLVEGQLVHKRLIDKTEKQCISRAHTLGLTKSWTKEELNIIEQFYSTEGRKILKRLPNRTWGSIQTQASKLNVKTSSKWTNDEIKILKQYYPDEGINVSKYFRNHDGNACKRKATKLGIVYNNPNKWTNEDITILQKFYPLEGGEVVKRLPNHTLSACRAKAEKLGITITSKVRIAPNTQKIKNVETDEVFESIKLGAASIGLNEATVRASLYNPNRTAGGYHWKYVED